MMKNIKNGFKNWFERNKAEFAKLAAIGMTSASVGYLAGERSQMKYLENVTKGIKINIV